MCRRIVCTLLIALMLLPLIGCQATYPQVENPERAETGVEMAVFYNLLYEHGFEDVGICRTEI